MKTPVLEQTARELAAAPESTSLFGRSPLLLYGALAVIFGLGMLVRLLDLTDQPLDFHPTRQLRGAIIARGMYYQMAPQVDDETRALAHYLWQTEDIYEPSILERLVSLGYALAGGERLWLVRIYNAFFWSIGGLGIFALSRRMSTVDGGVIALAYYMILPFGIISSRSFQPETFMVMWMILAAYAFYRWTETEGSSWRWTILAGAAAGIAILVKITSLLPLAGMALFAGLSTTGFRGAIRSRQVWTTAALMVIIPALYYLLTIGGASAGFLRFWTISLADLLVSPAFYLRWLNMLHGLLDLTVILVGLAGVLLLPTRARSLMLGLWVGYALYGLALPHQIHTHDYYNLLLIPIVALSIAPVAAVLLARIGAQSPLWRAALLALGLAALAYPAWNARTVLYSKDYRLEAPGWVRLSATIPTDGPIIALTHDYGKRLKYYGMVNINLWPYVADLNLVGTKVGDDFGAYFERVAGGNRYFVVTHFGELNSQPALKQYLNENYESFRPRESIQIFDLHKPLGSS